MWPNKVISHGVYPAVIIRNIHEKNPYLVLVLIVADSNATVDQKVSIAIAVVTLVLTMLALLAGKSPDFLEDYHVLLMNTSSLGQNLIPTATTGNSSPSSCGPLGGHLGKLCAEWRGGVGA